MSTKNYQDTSWMFAQPHTLPELVVDKPPRPQHNHMTTLIVAAWVIGGSTGLVALVLASILTYVERALWPLIPIAILSGLIVAAILTIIWTKEAATRAWRQEDEDRWYKYNYNPDTSTSKPLAETEALRFQNVSAPPTDRDLLRLAGHNILTYHYTTGKDATRPECELDLKLTQDEWNKVNRILIELGIKGQRKWLMDDIATALRKWQTCLDLRADGKAWVKDHEHQSQWRLIEL